jgi:hydrogenase maturation protease
MIACFGNILRGDDGFGVAVARVLSADPPPAPIEVMEVGIGGIHLVQELLGGEVEALLVVDAVDVGHPPGSVVTIIPDVQELTDLPTLDRRELLADMHYATPERALMLARELGVLPPTVRLVGCQSLDAERVGEGLSPAVERAVPVAVSEIRRLAASAARSELPAAAGDG